MKILLPLSLLLYSTSILGDKAFSLSNYQIEKTCMKEKRKSTCIKNLKERRSNLQKGNFIEIPVIPYKRD